MTLKKKTVACSQLLCTTPEHELYNTKTYPLQEFSHENGPCLYFEP